MGDEIKIKGISAAPGIAIGKAFLYMGQRFWVEERDIPEDKVESEIARFLDALKKVALEIKDMRNKARSKLGDEHARIFDAHLMMLEDPVAVDETVSRIRNDRKSAEFAFFRTMRRLRKAFDRSSGSYLRERAVDVEDIGWRVLRKLSGKKPSSFDDIRPGTVIVARSLAASDTITMPMDKVCGFVTDIGGRTSHTAIIARALEIPAVVGTEDAYLQIEDGDTVIVDGSHGLVIVNPSEETLKDYKIMQRGLKKLDRELSAIKDLPASTTDGRKVKLFANLEMPEEVNSALLHGAEGIGLYRTEFLYLMSPRLPSEEEQFRAYRKIAEMMAPKPVVIRTVDLGGDKLMPGDHGRETNPFLGWRAIRVCLERRDMFKVQIRAILRAGTLGNVSMMFPMISSLDEVLSAKEIVEEVKEELEREGAEYSRDCKIGVMIEVPSAAVIADRIAEEVDFFSIGTNDLIQYAVAVDRGNERIAYLFDHFNPGVLRLIRDVIEAGHNMGIEVAMCGEMAAAPLATPLLIGMELDEFSMSPIDIPEVKRTVLSISYEDCKSLSKEAMYLRRSREIRELLSEFLKDRLGEMEDLWTK